MTLSRTTSLVTGEALSELDAIHFRLVLSVGVTREMVRVPSPVPGAGMEILSLSITFGVLPLPRSRTQ